MFRPLEAYIGLRYTRAKRRNHFISFISFSSMAGIALGVTALITVLSVMNGFEKELRGRILGMASHATISGVNGRLADWPKLARLAGEHSQVIGVAPYVRGEVMLSRGSYVRGAVLRGILPGQEGAVSEIQAYMEEGSIDALQPGAFNIIVGADLARVLGLRVGDKLTTLAPQPNVTPIGVLPRLKRFTVAGIFRVGHAQYDSALALVHLRDAAKLFRFGETVSGLRIRVDKVMEAPRVSQDLGRSVGRAVWVSDWTQVHANFFRALKTEKTVMFIILALIVAVAAFNIVATLMMVVVDKESDIAILRTLGLTPRRVMGIFIVQGTVIGLFGTLLGIAGGIALALNVETIVPAIESLFETKFLAADVYYISEVPSDLRWEDVSIIAVVAFLMTIVATFYPAWRASRTHPATALRYE